MGKSPDGDSIRLRPESPELIRTLENGDRARASSDGTFQLRLDGIDAPETHYNGRAQPLGVPARDALLAWCGFADVRWRRGRSSATPDDPAPLAKLVDVNGRPVVFLLRDALPPDGEQVEVDWATANAALRTGALRDAHASTDRAARRSSSRGGRRRPRRVAARREQGLRLTSQDSIGPEGSLILPKLFRRCTDYLRSRNRGRRCPGGWSG